MMAHTIIRNVCGTDYVYIPRCMALLVGARGQFIVRTARGSAEISAPVRRTGNAYRVPIYKRENADIGGHGTAVTISTGALM